MVRVLLAVVAGMTLSGCSGVDTARADLTSVRSALAEHAAELVDAGPDGPAVLLAGASDPGRQFAAALALAPHESVEPYLPQLAEALREPGVQADVTAMAGRLGRFSGRYSAALFPSGRMPRTRAERTDCARITSAALGGDLRAATRLRDPSSPAQRCGTPPAAVLDRARTEATRLAGQIRRWRSPSPGQILELRARLGWAFAYEPQGIRAAVSAAADALAEYLDAYAAASRPFLPNLPTDELLMLSDIMHEARPGWRPATGYLAQLRRTLGWQGRLAEQIRNDPITLVHTLRLLEDSPRGEVSRALPLFRARVLTGGTGPLDTGLRAIAARRGDLITDEVIVAASAQVRGDPRLAARLAGLVSHTRRCPAAARLTLTAQRQVPPEAVRLPVTGLYYQALIARALGRCSGQAIPRALATALADRQAMTVAERPDWQGWFELWLLTESSCAVNARPRLDMATLGQAASRMLATRDAWSKFDPATAYAMSRSLDIAEHGCAGAWYDPVLSR